MIAELDEKFGYNSSLLTEVAWPNVLEATDLSRGVYTGWWMWRHLS